MPLMAHPLPPNHPQHRIYMERALELAQAHLGETSPNPTVGAVIVKQGRILGEGWHQGPGHPHAEVIALAQAGEAARGADMYVTLEPCDHYGRTPPCSLAIIRAGIARVFYAIADPNPIAAGGAQRMKAAGIQVFRGLAEEEAREINRFFFHFIRTGRPYVIAKFAASLDGKIATRTGESQWITGSQARARAHTLRSQVDAILVGAGTVLADDPRLTVRDAEGKSAQRQPLRVILDTHGRIPLHARVLQPSLPGQTLIATTPKMPPSRQRELARLGVEVRILPPDAQGWVSWPHLLDALGERQITSIMVEGGAQVLGSCFQAGVVQEVWAFLAPMIIGGQEAPGPIGGLGFARLAQAPRLTHVQVESLGKDWLFRGKVETLESVDASKK